MRTLAAPVSDPAPSRLHYRMQRLLLTPAYVKFMRKGLPALLVAAFMALFFASETRRLAISAWVSEVRLSIETRPEFMLSQMEITGASPHVIEDIDEVVQIGFPVSSFALDLSEIQSAISGLDAVKHASLRVAKGNILRVHVVERSPAVVWRGPRALELLDADGHRVSSLAERSLRADLSLIAGNGADEDVPGALALLAAAEPISERLRGLVRVGERRWDVVLTNNQIIQLPSQQPVAALDRVIAWHEAQDLLDRQISRVDMRNPERPVLQMTPIASEAMNQIRNRELGITGQ